MGSPLSRGTLWNARKGPLYGAIETYHRAVDVRMKQRRRRPLPYIIIGGAAIGLMHPERLTTDVDINVLDLKRVHAALLKEASRLNAVPESRRRLQVSDIELGFKLKAMYNHGAPDAPNHVKIELREVDAWDPLDVHVQGNGFHVATLGRLLVGKIICASQRRRADRMYQDVQDVVALCASKRRMTHHAHTRPSEATLAWITDPVRQAFRRQVASSPFAEDGDAIQEALAEEGIIV